MRCGDGVTVVFSFHWPERRICSTLLTDMIFNTSFYPGYYRAQSLTFFSNEPKLSQAFRAVLPMLKITLVSTNFATEDSKNKNVIYAKSMTKRDTLGIYIKTFDDS